MATFNTHDLGDLVRVYTAEPFANALTGVALDPTTVKLSIKTPAGVVTTYVYGIDAIIVRDGTGDYHADIDANDDGIWYYRWWGTGTGQAAEERRFKVREAMAV